MTTKILIPRGSGEGGIGAIDSAWGQAYFDTGNFNKGLFVSGKNIQQVVSDVVAGGGLGGVWDSGPAGVIYYNGGNVGIGTTNPSTKLDVVNSSNTEVTSTFNNAGGSAPATIHIIEDESSQNHVGLFVGASDLSSAVLTTKHTSVGIGTRNPNGNLDINSKTTKTLADHSIAVIRLQNGFTSIFNSALIDARTDVLTSGVTDYTDKVGLMFASMGNEHMRIDSTGNVGIGTPSPVSKLDIHGSLSFKSKGTYVSATNAGGDVNSNDLTLTAANSTNSIVARSAQNIIFQVFDPAPASVYREVMRITHWGAGANVGIGTANPGASNKLYVNGNIFANGTITPTSDDRVKHNEQNIVGAIETLSKLTPKKYIKTTEMYEADHDFELDADGNPVDDNGEPVKHTIEAGVIAQKVLEVPELAFMVSPEGVDEDGNVTSPHGLNYNSLFTYAIAAIQEQQQLIEDLRSEVEALKNK